MTLGEQASSDSLDFAYFPLDGLLVKSLFKSRLVMNPMSDFCLD